MIKPSGKEVLIVMSDVCVITGGGSGMGLSAALQMPKEKIIIVSGRTVTKLENAVEKIKESGHEAYAFPCDTSDRESVYRLAQFAASKGNVTNVINAAGMSPNMAKPEALLRVNALGTVYVNQEFFRVMKKGSVIVDISSNSAYVLPKFLISKKTFALAESNEEMFIKKSLKISSVAKGDYARAGLAYALSKNFVIWYAQKCAFEYGEKGIRVCSLSPGLIATDMGKLEEKEGGAMLAFAAEKRMGTPDELGYAIATVADERNGYLAGVDILVDGGSTVGKQFRKK